MQKPNRLSPLISVGPSVTITPKSVTVNESNNVTLTCNTSGIASPTIQWTKVDEDAVLFVGPVYTIYNISRVPGNTAWYRCSSNNRTHTPTFHTAVNITVQCEYIILLLITIFLRLFFSYRFLPWMPEVF